MSIPSGDGDLCSYDPAVAVSAVVVNWNAHQHLELCLGSLLRQTVRGIEVIMVDNASTDGSVEFARQRFGNAVRIIQQSENIGYGSALNQGFRKARGRYLFALNCDTDVAPTCLATLVDVGDRYPNAGSLAPKILNYAEPEIIDNVGHLLYPDGLSRGRGRLERDRGQFDREEEILIFSGCAVLLRRAMLADIGLFDPDLFAYCEDTDLGLRAQLAGWRCRYVPGAVVRHKYSATTSAYSPEKAFLVERNRVWVSVRCLPTPMLVASPVFTLLRLVAQAWGALTGRGAAGRFTASRPRGELVGVLVRAWAAALRGLPGAWRKRRRTQATRRTEATAFIAWMRHHRMGLQEVALKD
jgi:GT2 family glycosyltransferase